MCVASGGCHSEYQLLSCGQLGNAVAGKVVVVTRIHGVTKFMKRSPKSSMMSYDQIKIYIVNKKIYYGSA